MSERTQPRAEAGEPELLITREFDAPRELVFRAYTEADQLARWWGPKGFTMLRCTLDLRPGGLFHYAMRSPDGVELWGKLVYREVAAPERLAFVVSFADAQGGTVRAPFSAAWPLEVLSTLTFIEQNGKTTLSMRSVPVTPTAAERQAFAAGHESVRQGTALSLDQLAAHLTDARSASRRCDGQQRDRSRETSTRASQTTDKKRAGALVSTAVPPRASQTSNGENR